jgi:hypothetical protein
MTCGDWWGMSSSRAKLLGQRPLPEDVHLPRHHLRMGGHEPVQLHAGVQGDAAAGAVLVEEGERGLGKRRQPLGGACRVERGQRH